MIQELIRRAAELEERVKRDGATARDVAIAHELAMQYIDELERLEKTATVKPYLTGDTVADKVLSYWSYDE